MKNRLAVLLILVVSLFMFSACENDADEADNKPAEETKTEIIEIASDNWQDYLEFGMVPYAVYEGNELVNIEIHNCIYIKDEYADAFVDGNIDGVVTASAGMPMAYRVG